jgi:diguanylate cyclase (GGDEF)-like protein
MGTGRFRERARRLRVPLGAAAIAAALLALAVWTTIVDHDQGREDVANAMQREAAEHAQLLDAHFARARALTKQLAHNPAFRDFYELPGTRAETLVGGSEALAETNAALAYTEGLFPGSIGEACFIDQDGSENGRAVDGRVAPADALSTEEAETPFFAPSFALRPGQVYQARPYVSPDTGEWVVSNSTPVSLPAGERAIVHFEISVESFRKEVIEHEEDYSIAIVDQGTGGVVLDTDFPQEKGAPLGPGGEDAYQAALSSPEAEGKTTVDGHVAAFERLPEDPNNANRWNVVATSRSPTPSWLGSLGAPEAGLIGGAVLLGLFALLSFASSQRTLRDAALADPLTGLGNRRKLMADLESRLGARTVRPLLLLIYDLDGFKDYNDAFGHPAGDALLIRLSAALRGALGEGGEAYRIGGDEFCVLIEGDDRGHLSERASEALTERGEGFDITASRGSVAIPDETTDIEEALRLGDQRMYANKGEGRTAAGKQATDALLSVLTERHPDLGDHLGQVARLSEQVAAEMDVPEDERAALRQAAALHDVGKIAVPETVLAKPGPLDDAEWEFIRQHTMIGERILASAPALARASRLVRSSHERIDGGGYPDGLAGEEIPLGARIIAVCDAYDAMTSERPYAPPQSAESALSELRRCAGSQFDAVVVEALVAALGSEDPSGTARPRARA